MGIIYKITNRATGRAYVGSTSGTFESRYPDGRWWATSHSRALVDDAFQYGAASFDVEVLRTGVSDLELLNEEMMFVELLGTLAPHGYNQSYYATPVKASSNRHAKGRENRRLLLDLASAQQGYFSAPQAVESGYSKHSHSRFVTQGDWERVDGARGIFRLAVLPEADRPDLVTTSLWSRGTDGEVQGVISHASALSLWELGDVNPDMVDMTVPPGFRRNTTPPYPCRLHLEELRDRDIDHRPGYRVTRPLASVVALLRAGETQTHQLREALREGVRRGLILLDEIEDHPMSEELRETVRSWLA